ncbi:predicted protein [Lichtheimia corymbifera JMRC:FSU:9682]|uniref:Uncharacterized protein n=1 Tax=Lichtheimia corymbifera JMRC:FSU:9682 TaxID=1263082 RepID=A0A068S8P3_9FUNG|nr:predicted protein [Lichtheimia corymbifera JMRC:FSU:9682]
MMNTLSFTTTFLLLWTLMVHAQQAPGNTGCTEYTGSICSVSMNLHIALNMGSPSSPSLNIEICGLFGLYRWHGYQHD